MLSTTGVQLNDLIGWIESKNDFKAFRFEPVVYARLSRFTDDSRPLLLQRIVNANNCSFGTARMIYSTSWGAYQIMGFNLYGQALDCKAKIADLLGDQMIQSLMFDRFLKTINADGMTPRALALSPLARERLALKYNGSREYLVPMVGALRHFGFNVCE